MKEIRRLATKIREKKIINAINNRIDKPKGKAVMPRASRKRERERSVSRLRSEFQELGVDMSDVQGCHFTRTKSSSRSRPPLKKARTDSEGRVRSSSKMPRDLSGVRDMTVRNLFLQISVVYCIAGPLYLPLLLWTTLKNLFRRIYYFQDHDLQYPVKIFLKVCKAHNVFLSDLHTVFLTGLSLMKSLDLYFNISPFLIHGQRLLWYEND